MMSRVEQSISIACSCAAPHEMIKCVFHSHETRVTCPRRSDSCHQSGTEDWVRKAAGGSSGAGRGSVLRPRAAFLPSPALPQGFASRMGPITKAGEFPWFSGFLSKVWLLHLDWGRTGLGSSSEHVPQVSIQHSAIKMDAGKRCICLV